MNPQFKFAELAAAQAQPHVVVNFADRVLSAAMAGKITIDFAADANYTLQVSDPALSTDEWYYALIEMTDNGGVLTGPRDVIYPDVGAHHRFLFTNSTAQTLTVKRSGQTGVPVLAGQTRHLFHDGSDIVEAPGTGQQKVVIQVACSDLETDLEAGTTKGYARSPEAFVCSEVRASLLAPSSAGAVVIDINKSGVSMLSTPLTIDQGETTSETAAAPPVIDDGAIDDDELLTFDIDAAGTGARGLIVTMIGVRS